MVTIKKMLWVIFCNVAITIFSAPAIAQPGDMIDSLITSKKEFKKNENIEFTVRLEKKRKNKSYNLRQVPTMSCACSNKDFYYEIYSIAVPKYPSQRKAFLMHNEKPTDKQCLCKSGFKEFHENQKYVIPGISKDGNYLLIIRGYGFIMYSNVFEVTK